MPGLSYKNSHIKEYAKHLKSEGHTYQYISNKLCIGRTTAICWIDLNIDTKIKSNRKKLRNTEAYRMKEVLTNSKREAKKRGFLPCFASIQELITTLHQQNYKCKICQKSESELEKLCCDHDHKTGQFRGWLCARCNKYLGCAETLGLDKILSYISNVNK